MAAKIVKTNRDLVKFIFLITVKNGLKPVSVDILVYSEV